MEEYNEVTKYGLKIEKKYCNSRDITACLIVADAMVKRFKFVLLHRLPKNGFQEKVYRLMVKEGERLIYPKPLVYDVMNQLRDEYGAKGGSVIDVMHCIQMDVKQENYIDIGTRQFTNYLIEYGYSKE